MYNMLLIGTKVKSSDSVGIKPNRRALEKEDDVKLEKKDANTNLTPFDSPSRLYYDDLKSLLPQCIILWQVLYSLLIVFSLKLFKNRKNVFIHGLMMTYYLKSLSLAAVVILISFLQCLF